MNLSFGKRIRVPFSFVLLFAFCWLGTWICSCFFSLSLRTIPQLILRGGSFLSLLWLLFSLLTAWEHRVHAAGKTLIFFLRILLILFSFLAGTFLALLEAFAFTPEHAVVKYEIPMIARVHSFLDESVSYYEDKGPLFYGKELGYEYYGSGGNDPISDGNSSPISWYFYDLDGNLLDHGGSF